MPLKETIRGFREIIDGLRARGYTFKTMNDVIAASRKRLVFNTSIVERP